MGVEMREDAQIFTVEALLASLIILSSLLFVPSVIGYFEEDHSRMQLLYYSRDVLTVLSQNTSSDGVSELEVIVSSWNEERMRQVLEENLPENVGYSVEIHWNCGSAKLVDGGASSSESVYWKVPLIIHNPSDEFKIHTGISDRSGTEIYCAVEVVLILWYR